MNIFVTSDTHFCHDRQFIYGPRGFRTVEEMNEAIVERWNSIVTDEDVVYLLGDVMLNDNDKGMEFLSKLNGSIVIITGNHDTDRRIALYNTLPNVTVVEHAHIVRYRGYTFYLSHYITLTSNFDAQSLKQSVINLHGHTHQKNNFYNDFPLNYHVGVDSHDCYPVSLDKVIDDIKDKVQECIDML